MNDIQEAYSRKIDDYRELQNELNSIQAERTGVQIVVEGEDEALLHPAITVQGEGVFLARDVEDNPEQHRRPVNKMRHKIPFWSLASVSDFTALSPLTLVLDGRPLR